MPAFARLLARRDWTHDSLLLTPDSSTPDLVAVGLSIIIVK